MTAVIKLGGRVQSVPDLPMRIAEAWIGSGRSLCVVHGGGDEVSTLQRKLGREPSFMNGRRITGAEDLELLRMVLSGSANKTLVSSLISAGLPAVGISGEDAAMIEATAGDGYLGRAGKPQNVKTDLLELLLKSGYVPVISPVSRDMDSEGAPMNVNGDDAAAAIAVALNAALWLISDVEAVLDERGEPHRFLDAPTVGELVSTGAVSSGMQAKLEAGFAALAAGVAQVRIGGVDSLRDPESGTTLSIGRSVD